VCMEEHQRAPQLRDLEHGTDIVVATPGRLNDVLEMQKISLSQGEFLCPVCRSLANAVLPDLSKEAMKCSGYE
ncbi:putative RNA helicase, partial [Tanacetum coccineum]